MLKISYEDFKEEIRAEFYGYEEISEEAIAKWFNLLEAFVEHKKKSTFLNYKGDSVEVVLKDEADLFMMVDKYLAAIINEDLENYFKDWSL